VLISHRDDCAVSGSDLVQIRGALEERGTFGHGGTRAGGGQRQHCHGLTGRSEHVYALMPVLQRQVHPRVSGYAAAPPGDVPDPPVTGRQELLGPCLLAPCQPGIARALVQPVCEPRQQRVRRRAGAW
jgi:hypothetical protein